MKYKFSSKASNVVITLCILSLFILYILTNKSLFKQNRYEIRGADTVKKHEEVVDEDIFVHITGEVKNSGVVKMKKGSRLFEAIEEVGGFTEKADKEAINLAQILVDGYKYHIPNENEVYYEENTNKININTATKEDLMKIDGIGEKMAERIIKYRKKNGPFSNIEELKDISGIGENKFEMIKEYVVC